MLRSAILDHGCFLQSCASCPQCGDLHWRANWIGAREETSQSLRAALLVRSEGYLVGSSQVASQLAVVPGSCSLAPWHTCFRKWTQRPRDRDARCTPKERKCGRP